MRYIQQHWQGSVRTVTNANGFVVSRTDHQAFGGEVGYGTGQRSIEQGYNRDAATRQGYGLTERDEATGLDHTWFRKNESSAGRWTSPDPYKGSMSLGDPQSFNRYSYVQNQPTNFVDPSGLLSQGPRAYVEIRISWWDRMWEDHWGADNGGDFGWMYDPPGPGISSGGGNGGGSRGDGQKCPPKVKDLIMNPIVLRHLQQAWNDSGYNTNTPHEEGGWIYANSDGFVTVIRAPPGGQAEIDLKNPPAPASIPGVAAFQLVATFHTHPNAGEGWQLSPSVSDRTLAAAQNMPSVIRAMDGLHLTGPKRRGSDPKRAIAPGSLLAGYPGNAEDTRNCKS